MTSLVSAVDSSVIFSILKAEPTAQKWLGLLGQYSKQGRLVMCEVVAAEVSAHFDKLEIFQEIVGQNLGIAWSPISINSAWTAGQIFNKYRKEGGKWVHLIPDFLIAAHALNQANQLLSHDRGYYRTYFKSLKVIQV